MKLAMKSLAASSPRTKTFEWLVAQAGVVAEAATVVQPCAVFRIEDHTVSKVEIPAHHKSVGDIVNKWSEDATRRAALEQARGWIADTFHRQDGDTVRTLRLRKGWSQTQLANNLGTSQSHIARIERGTENVAVETCRRLCKALEIDMNTLDTALRRQEVLVTEKAK